MDPEMIKFLVGMAKLFGIFLGIALFITAAMWFYEQRSRK